MFTPSNVEHAGIEVFDSVHHFVRHAEVPEAFLKIKKQHLLHSDLSRLSGERSSSPQWKPIPFAMTTALFSSCASLTGEVGISYLAGVSSGVKNLQNFGIGLLPPPKLYCSVASRLLWTSCGPYLYKALKAGSGAFGNGYVGIFALMNFMRASSNML